MTAGGVRIPRELGGESDEGEPGDAVDVVGGDLGVRFGWAEGLRAEVADDPDDLFGLAGGVLGTGER